MEISILITTKDHEETFKKSFFSILDSAKHLNTSKEIIIVTPISYNFLKQIELNDIPITVLIDKREGKPVALNMAAKKATGKYLILTDGDTLVTPDSLNNLYNYTIKNNLSIAGGKPVSLNKKDNLMGYWAWALIEGNADRIRKIQEKHRTEGEKVSFPASGYLLIIKGEFYEDLDKDILVDDGYISHYMFKRGFSIGYCENALVYIKSPETYTDYVKQKLRTLAGFKQGVILKGKNRSFIYESVNGVLATLFYAKNLKELYWSILLILSRIHIWILVFYNIKIKKNYNLWEVIDSSKSI